MVKKILGFFNKETGGIHQAAYLLGFFAILSQVLALFRDRLLASSFGAGSTLDLYYSAFRIPDLLFVFVASSVSISVLIPFLLEALENGKEKAEDFLSNVFSFFFFFMVVIGLASFFLAPTLLKWLFPEMAKQSSFSTLVNLTRILLLSPAFLGFSNLLASITQTHKRFFLYAISPVLYNIGIIIGIVFLYPLFGLLGLGVGVVFGAFLHFAIQIPYVLSLGLFPRLKLRISWNTIKKIVFTSIPRTITVSSNELTELFLISFASLLIPGSISIFNFSFNLQSVPFSIIGVSYSLAAFPVLTKAFASGNRGEFVEQMTETSKHIIFWSIPISIMFIVLRAQIVRVILGAGKFNWDDTRLTAAALALFTVSLLAQNLVTLFVRAYYSRGKTQTPLLMNIISSVFIITLSYYLVAVYKTNILFRDFFESLLKVSDVPGTIVLMLPLGFSLGLILNVILHWVGFHKEFNEFSKSISRVIFQILGSSLIMGFVTYNMLNVFDDLFNLNTLLGIFLQGLCSGLIGIIIFIIVLYILKNKELVEIYKTLHRKVWNTKVISPDATLK